MINPYSIEQLALKEKGLSGIYAIYSPKSKFQYIGKAENIYKRWLQHKENLQNNCHPCKPLQDYYNRNKTPLQLVPIEFCPIEELEGKVINRLNTAIEI